MSLFRRHTANCPHRKKGRGYSLCTCPLWEPIVSSDGKRSSRSLGTSDLAQAEKGGAVLPPKTRRCSLEPASPLESVEIEAILTAVGTLRQESSRRTARAALLLLRDTGMRISDVALLKRQQVDFGSGRLVRTAKKNRKPITLPLSGECLEALWKYPVENSYFFHREGTGEATTVNRLRRLLGRVFASSGVERAHPHIFRHTLAANLAAQGVPILTIADILGDTPRTVERVYTRFIPARQTRIDEAIGLISHVTSD